MYSNLLLPKPALSVLLFILFFPPLPFSPPYRLRVLVRAPCCAAEMNSLSVLSFRIYIALWRPSSFFSRRMMGGRKKRTPFVWYIREKRPCSMGTTAKRGRVIRRRAEKLENRSLKFFRRLSKMCMCQSVCRHAGGKAKDDSLEKLK